MFFGYDWPSETDSAPEAVTLQDGLDDLSFLSELELPPARSPPPMSAAFSTDQGQDNSPAVVTAITAEERLANFEPLTPMSQSDCSAPVSSTPADSSQTTSRKRRSEDTDSTENTGNIKKPRSANFMFSSKQRQKVMEELNITNTAEVYKELARRLKPQSESLTMSQSHPPAPVSCVSAQSGQTTSRKRQREDMENTGYIKRPRNAYFIFSAEQRQRVAEELNITNSAEVNKELARRWKLKSAEEKRVYVDQAVAESAAHKLKHPGWSISDNIAINAKERNKPTKARYKPEQTSTSQAMHGSAASYPNQFWYIPAYYGQTQHGSAAADPIQVQPAPSACSLPNPAAGYPIQLQPTTSSCSLPHPAASYPTQPEPAPSSSSLPASAASYPIQLQQAPFSYYYAPSLAYSHQAQNAYVTTYPIQGLYVPANSSQAQHDSAMAYPIQGQYEFATANSSQAQNGSAAASPFKQSPGLFWR